MHKKWTMLTLVLMLALSSLFTMTGCGGKSAEADTILQRSPPMRGCGLKLEHCVLPGRLAECHPPCGGVD